MPSWGCPRRPSRPSSKRLQTGIRLLIRISRLTTAPNTLTLVTTFGHRLDGRHHRERQSQSPPAPRRRRRRRGRRPHRGRALTRLGRARRTGRLPDVPVHRGPIQQGHAALQPHQRTDLPVHPRHVRQDQQPARPLLPVLRSRTTRPAASAWPTATRSPVTFTEYANNPIIRNVWSPHYSVSATCRRRT